MAYSWTAEDNGCRARIATDFPAEALVYTSNMMMAQAAPLAALTNSMQFWGDIASANVIVRCRNSDTARAARAVCMDACIGCGRCKKECQNEAITVENGFAHIDPEKCTRCGACAAVCPCKCITIG